jgi:hypothetical protein
MEETKIWIFSDNNHGNKLTESIKKLGLDLDHIDGLRLNEINVKEDEINVFIFDIVRVKPDKLLKTIEADLSLRGFCKFVIFTKKEIKEVARKSYNMLQLEYIARPVFNPEFLLLLEKTIIVERYREILKFVSKESESRIEAYERLLDINRKNVFESVGEKEAFQKIVHYEKGLLKEQFKLNESIKDFSMLRQVSLYDMQKRISAEESLSELRQRELMDANEVINAQESLIDFSVTQLEETKEILGASEKVSELSRTEAIELHEELDQQKELNRQLASEVEELMKRLEELKAEKK